MIRPDTQMHASDYLVALCAMVAFSLGGAALAWITTPRPAPEPHYCFRADPPPCELTVRP
ncbi:hypothetical protein [Novosphingobium sp. FSW06-99]|uniref:hypothetical protein n=1 Tax=Novosphingobium sp. FSW06-99 TaxID=1739113 RepID=UPI00076C9EF9|nr:hypothetical protein [Novosphingobium sp. FSW06-99]KUR80933.1 hypothetical protein AQZ49_02605 [Novosphingobium sp. FSW06-99]